MFAQLKSAVAWMVVFAVAVMTTHAAADEHLKKNIRGSLNKDIYTSPAGDFRVRVPVRKGAGGVVRDESAKRGDMEISQVVFTDDFGSFFRVVSVKNGGAMESALNVFHDIRDKQELQTARGREIRVIDVEKEGAEITVTSIKKGEPPKSYRPDLVTANVIFTANGRIYHINAGVMCGDSTKIESETANARKELETFLAGFEAIPEDKPAK